MSRNVKIKGIFTWKKQNVVAILLSVFFTILLLAGHKRTTVQKLYIPHSFLHLFVNINNQQGQK